MAEIVIPGQAKEKPQQAEVIAVGPGGYAVFLHQCQNFSGAIVSKPDAPSAPDAVRRCTVDGANITPVVEILPVFPEKRQKGAI